MTANHCPDLATPQALYRRCCRRRRLRRRLPTSIRTTPLSLAPLSLAGMATESVATLSSEAPSAAEVSAQQQASGAAFLDGLEALCASAAPFLEQLAQQVRPGVRLSPALRAPSDAASHVLPRVLLLSSYVLSHAPLATALLQRRPTMRTSSSCALRRSSCA